MRSEALTRLWISWGVTPAVMLGHSLGEYAALNADGVLSAADTIYLVGKRAQELVTKCTPGTHAMLAVGLSVSSIEPYMSDHDIEVACINSFSETVLGGPNDEINKVAEELSRKGVKNTKLKIPFAFHISQVDSVLDSYEKMAKGVTLRPVVGIAVHLKYLLYKSRRHLACAGLNKIAWHCATNWVFMHGQSSWTKPNPIPCIIERFAAIDMIGDGGKNVSALHMLRGLEPRVRHLTPIEMSTYRRAAEQSCKVSDRVTRLNRFPLRTEVYAKPASGVIIHKHLAKNGSWNCELLYETMQRHKSLTPRSRMTPT